MNYSQIAAKRLEELSELNFLSEKNEILKNTIVDLLIEGNKKEAIFLKIDADHSKTINEINENSNIQIITKNKTEQEIEELLIEFVENHNEQLSLKKIESLEQKLINNLDESSYSELIKLKSQLNRD